MPYVILANSKRHRSPAFIAPFSFDYARDAAALMATEETRLGEVVEVVTGTADATIFQKINGTDPGPAVYTTLFVDSREVLHVTSPFSSLEAAVTRMHYAVRRMPSLHKVFSQLILVRQLRVFERGPDGRVLESQVVAMPARPHAMAC